MDSDIFLGLELMKYGLIGVFLVLILFYAVIVIMMKLFPHHPEKED